MVFQVSGLLLLVAILVVSAWPLYPGSFVRSPMNIVGAVLFAAGLVITVSAQVTIDRNYSWTLEIREDHTLVVGGLYSLVPATGTNAKKKSGFLASSNLT